MSPIVIIKDRPSYMLIPLRFQTALKYNKPYASSDRVRMGEIDNIVPGQRSFGMKQEYGVSVVLCSHSFFLFRTDFGEPSKLKSNYICS